MNNIKIDLLSKLGYKVYSIIKKMEEEIDIVKQKYFEDIKSYEKYVSNDNEHKLKLPYNESEVPTWYPKALKLYLTKVSREIAKGLHPHIVQLHDPSKTMEEIIESALKNMQKEELIFKNNLDESEKYELNRELKYSNSTLDELREIYDDNERIVSIQIIVGSGGCSFYDACNPVLENVSDFCYDDLADYGEKNKNKILRVSYKNGIPIWKYLGFTNKI